MQIRLDSSLDTADGRAWGAPLGSAVRQLRCEADGLATLREADGTILQSWHSPLAALAWMEQYARAMREGLRWVGYLSYELGRFFEALPVANPSPDLPLFVFSLHRVLPNAVALPAGPAEIHSRLIGSNFTREQYLRAVQQAMDYIAAGDIFQVNLAQQLYAETSATPAELYAALQQRHPARFGALLEYGDFALICNSPELFLRVEGAPDGLRRISTRPIKGTRPRLPGMEEQLRQSLKDQAELNMIIDLERNDLGRICQIGSVRVTTPREIEAHPTVYHGAATIEGVLRPEVHFVDLLRATFPGGSITGAPKIRAMQIIDELEPTRRGPYCGAIGYLDADGSMQFNIAIRTLVASGNRVAIPVGGGIVADSQPQSEYDETLTKARAALEALGIQAGSLD